MGRNGIFNNGSIVIFLSFPLYPFQLKAVLGKNSPGLIDPKTFSSNSGRLFKIIGHDQCYKNKACDLYQKIKLGWKARKLVFSLLDRLILL